MVQPLLFMSQWMVQPLLFMSQWMIQPLLFMSQWMVRPLFFMSRWAVQPLFFMSLWMFQPLLFMSQWMVGYLKDNLVDDGYFYLLTVHTGMRKAAGTLSNVKFILTGSNGDTGVRLLSDGKRVSYNWLMQISKKKIKKNGERGC